MTARRWTIPLTALLTAGFAAFVLVAVGAAGLLGWYAVRQTTAELLASKATEVIDALELELAAQLRPAVAQVEGLGALLASGEIDLADRPGLARVLLAGLASQPSLTAIFVVDDGYRVVAAHRGADGRLVTEVRDHVGNPAARALIEHARARGGTVWGDVLYSREFGDAVVNISYAAQRDGRVVATVGAGVTAGRLSTAVARLGAASGLTAFILYGEDRVLAHPALAFSAGGTSDAPLPALSELGDPAVARIWQAAAVPRLTEAAGESIEVGRIRAPTGAYLLVHKRLAAYGPTPWIVGVAVPETLLDPLMRPVHLMAGGAAALPLAGFVIAFLMGRLVAWPIRRATAGAEQVATLELDEVEPLPPSRIRELAAQAGAFNAMLATLRAFETYVPKSLVRRLIQAGRPDAVPSRERDMTVMFTDIAGFTSLSEPLPPGEVAALLNAHFALLAACVEAEGGTVDKYLGDGMLAFWGAPERVKGRAARACRSALAIREAIARDNARRREAGLAPIRVRIGIHRGPLVVGNIGAPGRINYTVVGDTVNLAQRLQELGKRVADGGDCVVVVSEALVDEAGPGFAFAKVGELAVRGRHEPVAAYALRGMAAPVTAGGRA